MKTITSVIAWMMLIFCFVVASCEALETSPTSVYLEPAITPEKAITPLNASALSTQSAVPSPMKNVGPTLAITPTPIKSLRFNWNYKVAYFTFGSSIPGSKETKIWVLENPYQNPCMVFSLAPGISFTNKITWSNDGQRIVFLQYIGQKPLITILNIDRLTHKEIELADETNSSFGLVTPLRWSADDQWIAFTVQRDGNEDWIETYFVNMETSEIQQLEAGTEFVSWFGSDPAKFLYLYRTKDASLSAEDVGYHTDILLGKLGVEEPLMVISDMGNYAPRRWFDITWAPDGKSAIAVSFESDFTTYLSKINFADGSWKPLSKTLNGIGNPSIWSPDGDWLVFHLKGRPFLWHIGVEESPELIKVPWTDKAVAKAWTKSSEFLLYQDNSALFAINPSDPNTQLNLLDFPLLNFPEDSAPEMNIWISPTS
jgi:hypothetical protein